jgi:UDP-hydrolysing UDP-N-acetyl-D-glucosamine 2-epimerase
MKNIAILTTTRADYDLLLPIYRELLDSKNFSPSFIVSGTHLCEKFGKTVDRLINDNVKILFKVNLNTENVNPKKLAISLAEMQSSYAENLSSSNIQGLIVLGDRTELMPIVLTTSLFNIPIIHIHGGEITEGAIDENIRHAISKFSYLHFPSTEDYRNRIIQMGEAPNRVFNVGSVGVDNVKKITPLSKGSLEKELGLKLSSKIMVVTIHSETTQDKSYQNDMINNFLNVLDDYSDWTVIFTGPNMDLYSDIISNSIHKYVSTHSNAYFFQSLGLKRYFSLLHFCNLAVGNTSSGIIEVPSFFIPSINIGDRQKGRISAKSVIHCDTSQQAIKLALIKAISKDFLEMCRTVTNPYEKSSPAKSVVQHLESTKWPTVLTKEFYDIN